MAKNIDLTGKTAVVTGAGSGIGAATARLLARHGAKVHVADIHGDAAAVVARQIGGGAVDHAIDVSRPEEVEALAKAVFDADGRVDILHNNAGIGQGGDIEKTTIEDWQRVIGVNLLGVAYGVQAFVPRMLAQGHRATIVNTASEAGLIPIARMAPYCASKFGVVGLSQSLDAELRSRGIRVVALCPGIINTPIIRNGIMRGQLGADQAKVIAFYDKQRLPGHRRGSGPRRDCPAAASHRLAAIAGVGPLSAAPAVPSADAAAGPQPPEDRQPWLSRATQPHSRIPA